jgi:PAS domain S-box-containing protein
MRILLVDDEPGFLEIAKIFLERAGDLHVETALSAAAALDLPDFLSFDAVVSDYEMPGMNGIEFLRTVRETDPHLPFLIFTGKGREEVVIEAIDYGVDFYVQKGGSPAAQFAELAHKIRRAVQRCRMEEELRLDEQRLEALYAFSQMREVPLEELLHKVLEEGIRLTGSLVGYIAFVSADEREMTMYAWSTSALEGCTIADKPLKYPVEKTGLWGEAVRQRRPVVTNDYAAENPLKRGIPEGHVPLIRHMNVPIFDADRIVLVAGVANKPAGYDETDVRQLTLLMNGVWQSMKRRRDADELEAAHARMAAAYEQLKETEAMLLAQCSELALQEEKLRASEERLRLAADGANIGIWDLNLITGEQVTTEKWAGMLGYTSEEIAGDADDWKKLIHPDDLPLVNRSAWEHFAGRSPRYDVEYRMRCRDGSWKWIHSLATVSDRDAHGRPIRMTGIQQDVTEKRQYRDQLKEANKKLILLSDVTRHDILNQITAILGYLGMLEESVPAGSPAERYLENIGILTATIHDQIGFTREYQELGVKVPEWQPAARVVAHAAAAARLEGIDLAVSVGGLEVYADPMIEKVFLNIFSNAARHADGITAISVSFCEQNGSGVLVIEDDGEGIPPSMKERIFNCGVGKNTGFGLFLVREILEINGMTIRENGEKGRGARFEIAIPRSSYRLAGSASAP